MKGSTLLNHCIVQVLSSNPNKSFGKQQELTSCEGLLLIACHEHCSLNSGGLSENFLLTDEILPSNSTGLKLLLTCELFAFNRIHSQADGDGRDFDHLFYS